MWLAIAITALGILASPVPIQQDGQHSGATPPTPVEHPGKESAATPAIPPGPEPSSPDSAASQAKPCPASTGESASSQPPCPQATPVKKKKRKNNTAVPPPAGNAPPKDDGPPKKVVRNGSTIEPVIGLAPGVTQQQASQQGQKASDLLTGTEGNLKRIGARQLSPAEQETVGQIKIYVEQAKAAANDGDVQRAYNLALKANLLSADLAGK